MGLEVVIDREACMGSGHCTFTAPGVFELDEDGIAVVVDVEAAPEADVRAAGRQCPAKAITVR